MASERKPRLCIMAKTENGYGFHLHGEKGKSGQYIRKVETGSPAEASGLRAGDRVVAVNGVNVEKETHHQASRWALMFLLLHHVAGLLHPGTVWHGTLPSPLVQTFETFLTVCPHETTCCSY